MEKVSMPVTFYLNLPFIIKEEDYLTRALHIVLASNNEVTMQ